MLAHAKHEIASRAAVSLRLQILELLVLAEVAEDPLLAVAADQVIGQERDFAAAARSVDHELRNSHAARPAAKVLDDLDALFDRGAEVADALRHVALENVVRPNAHHEE